MWCPDVTVNLSLVAVGRRMPDWVETGVQEYRKRLNRDLKLQVREVNMAQRGKNPDIERARRQEADALLAAVPEGDTIVALEVTGKRLSTPSLARKLQQWQMDGVSVSLLVGGPDGLHRDCLQAASEQWSLSDLTLPHPLVRVLLAEQIYRAWSINAGHPYHR